MWSISCGPRTLVLGERTQIMGILNTTPDSFSDGGRYNTVDSALAHAVALVGQGANIIDVGGESTRPGHQSVSAAEEQERVVPVIRAVREALPNVLISIDTQKAAVAEAALEAGADMLNDIWGLQGDPEMAPVAAHHGAPIVVMHNQNGTQYHDVMGDMLAFFRRTFDLAQQAGIAESQLIVDPGIGFGKTPLQNLEVLQRLAELKALGRPILLGTSRKSTIGKVLGGLPPEERVEGTAATVALGIAAGSEIIRVHDVLQMKRVAVMTDAIVRPGRGGFEG